MKRNIKGRMKLKLESLEQRQLLATIVAGSGQPEPVVRTVEEIEARDNPPKAIVISERPNVPPDTAGESFYTIKRAPEFYFPPRKTRGKHNGYNPGAFGGSKS